MRGGDGKICFSSYNQNTKASVATITTLKANGFGVWGSENQPDGSGNPTTWNPAAEPNFFDGYPVAQEVYYSTIEGGWTYDPIKYWSDDDRVTMNFIAFSPYDKNMKYSPQGDSDEYASFGPFAISTNIDEQEDYLVATKFDLPQIPKVVLEFQHVLSRIGFSAYAPSLSDGEGIQIDSIQLRATSDEGYTTSPAGFFYTSGYLTLKDETGTSGSHIRDLKWITDGTTKTAFTLTKSDLVNNGIITSVPSVLNLSDKYLMVIPQSNMKGMEIYVKYHSGKKDGDNWVWSSEYKEKEFTCPVETFDLNTAYTFNFKLGVSEVAFDCLVTDWEEKVYSLNASGQIYAQSSLEDCNVYVDAQRKVLDDETVTDYTLYAETKTITEDNVTKRMLPIWKMISKSDYTIDGKTIIASGDLMNVYLGQIDGLELYETTIEEDSKYTVLSFQINENTEDVLGTTYYADYVEDPISAYMVVDGTDLESSVDVSRTYSAYTGTEEWFYYPYTCQVTLTPTGSHTGAPFVKWQVSKNGGDFIDVANDADHTYTVGLGAALTFTEDNVYDEDNYTSNKYIYRAVYGTTTNEVVLYADYDNNVTLTAAPKVTSYSDAMSGQAGIAYTTGTAMTFKAAVKSGYTIRFLIYETLDKRKAGSDYTVIVSGSSGYTITTDSEYSTLTFNLTSSHSGNVIVPEYVSSVNVSWYIHTEATSGAEFKENSQYTFSTKESGSGHASFRIGDLPDVYTELGSTQLLLYSTGTSWQDVYGNIGGYDKENEGWTIYAKMDPQEDCNYDFIMQDKTIPTESFLIFIKGDGNIQYQLPTVDSEGTISWSDATVLTSSKHLITVNDLTNGIKLTCSDGSSLTDICLNGTTPKVELGTEVIIKGGIYIGDNTLTGGNIYTVTYTTKSAE